jgi:hypothetical protein
MLEQALTVARSQYSTRSSSRGRRRRWLPNALFLSSVLLLNFCGCSRNGPAKSAESQAAEARAAQLQARKAARTKEDAAREELEQILPPSKSLYLGIRSRDAYANPFLLVHPNTITLTIIFPDQNPNGFGTGGMLRPAKARRKQFEVRLRELPDALSSLPPEVWPYGRVVGLEESPSAPGGARVAIRRNVEATIQVLSDLGVVVDEWTGSTGTLLR